MQIGRFDQRSDVLAIAESLQRLITNVDRMEDIFLPVGVLVDDGGQDFLQVELVRVADKGAEESVASIHLHAILIIIGAESEIGLGLGHSEE